MFFSDRTRAIQEMLRVLTPGGRFAVAVWDSLENIPAYASLVELLHGLPVSKQPTRYGPHSCLVIRMS
jgi:ubiquinone/menaquinone biosynthesis C-methylase UbiE